MSAHVSHDREDRVAGILLGTAMGDALGLACEGLSAATIKKRFHPVNRYQFLFGTGYGSDDTEQSALIAQSIARGAGEPVACLRHFRRALLGWFLRLPWGVGFSTLRACLRLCIGLRNTGIQSAGNGAAMRSAIIGGYLPTRGDRRRELTTTLAEVTHADPRAIAGANFVADLAAACVRRDDGDRARCFDEALESVGEPELRNRLEAVREYHSSGADHQKVARAIGTGGFVLESVPLAAFCFLADGEPLSSLGRCIGAGGDTDTNAAILGGWLGALHGASGLPEALVDRLQGGPFGREHLRQLAAALVGEATTPGYSWLIAMLRNLALYPVVLGHGLRRLAPW
jgi:ADP-ribosylglycohydrolase